MRIFEIENSSSEKLETFLHEVKKDTDPNVLKIVLENPLYRGYSEKPDNKDYGKYEIPKNRKPRDNIPCLSQKLDTYLLSRRFEAIRSNSIFCTGSYSVAGSYAGESSKILRVIPAENFSFTWNPEIKDFVATHKSNLEKYFNVNPENLRKVLQDKQLRLFFSKESSKILYDKIYSFYGTAETKEKFKKIVEDLENENFEKLDQYYEIIMDRIERFIQNRQFENFLERDIIDIFLKQKKEKEICEFLEIDPESDVSRYTDDYSTLKEAISSGHEIMITGDYYYYFTDPFFEENEEIIKNILLRN